jgi:hypothetical protein
MPTRAAQKSLMNQGTRFDLGAWRSSVSARIMNTKKAVARFGDEGGACKATLGRRHHADHA